MLQNAIRIHEDGVILKSCDVHDCVVHTTPSGKRWMLDGGTEYCRMSAPAADCDGFDNLCIESDAAEDEIDERLVWGTHGPYGTEPMHWVLLRDCGSDHLNAILTISWLGDLYRNAIGRILKGRK